MKARPALAALSLKDAVGLVIATNPEVGVTVKDRRAIDYELRQARALYYPQIDVRLDAGIDPGLGLDRAAPGLDQPLAAEEVERSHDRRSADVESLGECALGRQTHARLQVPSDDRRAQLVARGHGNDYLAFFLRELDGSFPIARRFAALASANFRRKADRGGQNNRVPAQRAVRSLSHSSA